MIAITRTRAAMVVGAASLSTLAIEAWLMKTADADILFGILACVLEMAGLVFTVLAIRPRYARQPDAAGDRFITIAAVAMAVGGVLAIGTILLQSFLK